MEPAEQLDPEEWSAILDKFLEIAIPAAARAGIAALTPSAAELAAAVWLTGPRGEAGHRFVADLAPMSGWRARMKFAFAHLFPSIKYMQTRYEIRHPLLVPFYYSLHWLRGLRTLGPPSG